MKLRALAVSGGLASAGGQSVQLLLTLAYNAVLARLLRPHDFGLIAMVSTVAALLQVFKEAGLSTATIQRDRISEGQVSNLFWINVAVSGAAAALMAGVSPLTAAFFREPELVPISLVMSGAFLLDGLAAQHLALLNRQMRFSAISLIEVLSAAGGLVIGILLAATGWSYWSLVGATLSTAGARLLAIWLTSGWRPQRPTRGSDVWSLVSFGFDLTLVGLVYSVSRSCDAILIGRYLGADALGLYSRATALLTRPIERLVNPIYAVIVPVLSRLQQEKARYRRAFLQVFEGLTIFGCFFTGLFLPLAEPVVIVVLGASWAPVAPVFAALTVAALHIPLGAATSWLYTSQGRGRDLLKVAILGGAMTVVSVSLGLKYGPRGVAAAYSASGILVVLPLTFWLGGSTGPVNTTDLWVGYLSHWPVLAVVLGSTFATVAWCGATASPVTQLAVCVPVGVMAGLLAVAASGASRRVATGFLRSWRSRRHDVDSMG